VTEHVHAATRSRYAARAVEIIFEQPIFRTSDFVERLGAPRRSALNVLDTLREIGILQIIESWSGQRPDTLALVELLRIMR